MYRKDSIAIGEWIKNSNKALLVTGARQIGKTWLIRDEIEKSGYTKFEVNFIDQPDMVSYLNAEMSAEDFLIKLKMIMPEDCKSHETVVFFDEIQKCPEIVTKIKFLVDEGSNERILIRGRTERYRFGSGWIPDCFKDVPYGFRRIYDGE